MCEIIVCIVGGPEYLHAEGTDMDLKPSGSCEDKNRS